VTTVHGASEAGPSSKSEQNVGWGDSFEQNEVPMTAAGGVESLRVRGRAEIDRTFGVEE